MLALLLFAKVAFAGTLKVLSYNVAGLPELLSSGDPAVNTPLIGARLGPYGIINVQEDFNYHAALYAADSHVTRTPTSGGVPFGDGLNTLSDYDYIDLQRIKWNDCNLNSGDCLTPKGFSFLRLRLGEGAWVDVYNLHTDAGSDSGDVSARAKNLAQVSSFIQKWSVNMPIIVMGDTNARWSRESSTLTTFVNTNSVTDAWLSLVRKGSAPTSDLVCVFPFPSGTSATTLTACETVDKIFSRSNGALTLTQTAFTNEHNSFINSTGFPLSDHYPISTTFTWTLSSTLRIGDPMGGPHGDPFNDIPASGVKLTSFTVRGGDRVDGFTYKLSNGATITRGGSGGTATTLDLASGERVVQVVACQAKYSDSTRVFYFKLTTSSGRTITTGKTTSDCLTSTAPSGWGLVGGWGRHGEEIDRFAPVFDG